MFALVLQSWDIQNWDLAPLSCSKPGRDLCVGLTGTSRYVQYLQRSLATRHIHPAHTTPSDLSSSFLALVLLWPSAVPRTHDPLCTTRGPHFILIRHRWNLHVPPWVQDPELCMQQEVRGSHSFSHLDSALSGSKVLHRWICT